MSGQEMAEDMHSVAERRLRLIDQANDEFTRYELAEDLTEHHHHLLCVHCGKVIDVTLPADLEQQVANAIATLTDAEGFQVHSHRLDVLGLCKACR